ncbi:hypothetical protein CA235_18430 [Sphingomonas sp. ABOLF]|uniref:hypothetical protein n=1 Tax=Sphingomonas sp. ABOLF TaxID=1985879 RepID=UPI000F7E5C51|nr:hypothetical protein [Sphingomonas sp. ABOLF]RSV11647.1 hypothetical protein CA235_18430 [Sphingomonas sp. ABOLF]
MTEPQKRLGMSIGEKAARVGQLRRATEFVSRKAIAEALDIEDRSLRAKLDTDRGITDVDLTLAAAAVEAQANAMLALVASIRERLA